MTDSQTLQLSVATESLCTAELEEWKGQAAKLSQLLHVQTTKHAAPVSRPTGLHAWLHSPAADILQLILLASVLLLDCL